MKKIPALTIVRYSLALLFLWFSIQQLIDPLTWVSYLPEWTGYLPIPGNMLVRMNGWFELISSLMLFVGIYTRLISTILGIHLVGISWTAGGAVGVRDASLAGCTFALASATPDKWSLDYYAINKIQTEHQHPETKENTNTIG